jgi:acyl-CoA thioester hydrolase
MSIERPAPLPLSAFAHTRVLQTRWADNDLYGHVNNVVYYSYFDTVVNAYLIDEAVLDPPSSRVIGLVVDTRCHYFRPLAFPQRLIGALRTARVGTSSVTYEIGIFAEGDDSAAAQGHFVHVYVDRDSRRPVKLPDDLRRAVVALKRD